MDLNALLAFVPAQDFGYATAVITVCAVLVAVLPPPKDMRTGYGYVWQVIDIIALNFAQGKTASKAVATGAVVPVLPRPTVQTTFNPPAMPRGPGPQGMSTILVVILVLLLIGGGCRAITAAASRPSAARSA